MCHFGGRWERYTQRLEENWRALVGVGDLVAIAGDISWAMRLDAAEQDFSWLESLPGIKVLVRGNHDYWWTTAAKLKRQLPPSCRALTGPAIQIGPVAFVGTRLWESSEISCAELFKSEQVFLTEEAEMRRQALFERELNRLERSLQSLSPTATIRVALTHFPPIGSHMEPTRVSQLFEKWKIDWAVFGHLHGLPSDSATFGSKCGVHYALTAADYLGFVPIKLFEFFDSEFVGPTAGEWS